MAIGRPRSFDIDEALDAALLVFWRKGYDGASLPELTKAMGINRPSLYAAFGNKEELFRKALDRYSEKSTACMTDMLAAPTAREAVEQMLRSIADVSLHPETPRGCLYIQALACDDEGEPIHRELIVRRGKMEIMLRKRFERAVAEGELPVSTSAADLASFIATLVQGMAVQTTSGASRETLHGIVDVALNAWPRAKGHTG